MFYLDKKKKKHVLADGPQPTSTHEHIFYLPLLNIPPNIRWRIHRNNLINTYFSQFSCYYVKYETVSLVSIKNKLMLCVTWRRVIWYNAMVMSEERAASCFTVRSAHTDSLYCYCVVDSSHLRPSCRNAKCLYDITNIMIYDIHI
jgi:hypothetical protein